MMTLLKLNPFNFSAAAVACSQENYVDRSSLQSALCIDCFCHPFNKASILFLHAHVSL